MQSLSLALGYAPPGGDPLPSPFRSLSNLGAYHRKGQVSLIAAPPNRGKSIYGSVFAVRSQVPTLYFAADIDRLTFASRAAAHVLNRPVSEIETLLREDDPDLHLLLEEQTEKMWFCWDRMISLDDIEEEVEAYGYANGHYPDLVVIDNLKDVVTGDEQDHVRFDRVISFLNGMAGVTESHVMVLHHVTKNYENGDAAVPLSGILGAGSRSARLVLSLYKPGDGVLGVRVVKNTNGRAEADASFGADWAFFPERMFIRD